MERIDLEENMAEYLEKQLRVYIGCSLTGPDSTGLRNRLLHDSEALFREFGFEVHNPSRFTPPGSPHENREVYAIDHLSVLRSDLIFFIRVQPSLGMGLEAQIAADFLIPWADGKVSQATYNLTPLVAGLPNRGTGVRVNFELANPDAFAERLRSRLENGEMQKCAAAICKELDVARAVIRHMRIGRLMRRQRLLLSISAQELGESVDIDSWWIESIERQQEIARGLTLIQLMRLVDALRLQFASNTSAGSDRLRFPELIPVDSFDSRLIQAADEFTDYSLRVRQPSEPRAETDAQMLSHWRQWVSKNGLVLPQKKNQVTLPHINRLTACLTMPMSNLNSEQEKERDIIQEELTQTLAGQENITIDHKFPEHRKSLREDYGCEIYLKTLGRLNECDFGISIISPPATGVGITTQLMANATLPCLVIAKEKNTVSRMLRGVPFLKLGDIVECGQNANLSETLKKRLIDYETVLCQSAARRRPVRDNILKTEMRLSIDRFRIPRKLSFEQALKRVKEVPYIRGDWLEQLAENPAVMPNVTLLQFVHIANQLNWRLGIATTGVPCLVPPCFDKEREKDLTNEQKDGAEKSLDNLLDALTEEKKLTLFQIEDARIFQEWEKYHHELTLDAADYEQPGLIRTKQKWLNVLLEQKDL